MRATIVFQQNWEAIHKECEACSGAGIVNNKSCPRCGDGQTLTKGSGKHYRYIINEGSSRSSKTYSMIDCYDLYGRESSDKRLTVWRDTKTDCRKTVLNDALKHLKKTGRYKVDQEFNKTEAIFSYPGGSTFEIHGTDDEEAVHGLSQDAAWFNEPYKISRETFDQIDQRTADFIFLDWNPKKNHFIDDLKKDPRAIVIKSTFKDNPFCPPEQRAKILSYQPVKFSEVVTSGLISDQDAKEYDLELNPLSFTKRQIKELSRCRENEHKNTANEFNWCVYGLGIKSERPNRIFKWNEISFDEYQKIDADIYTGCDWGAVDPWGILDAKYYDGSLYFHERNYDSENIIRGRLSPNELAQINSVEEGLVPWIFNRLNIDKSRIIVCDPNRIMKIRALRAAGFEYSVAAHKPPGSIIDGIDGLNDLRVYFTSNSPNLKYEQENYSRKVDRYGTVLEDPEDVDNHLMDCARYIYSYLRSVGIIRSF